MTQLDEITKAHMDAMPRERAAAVNLMAHPAAGIAAAGALGLGMASYAVGLWIGAIAGMTEASRKLLANASEPPRQPVSKPAGLKLVSSMPAPKAAAAKSTVAAEAAIAARATAEVAVETAPPPVAPVAKPARPVKAAAADDLKAISGIGPKLEKVLNGFGILTYEQVAGLTKAEISKLDDQLGFAGRIERDDWIGQATKLAAGEQ